MEWPVAAALGMIGGGIVEAVAVWGHLAAWQQARHLARRRGRRPPALTRFVDPAADALVAVTRLVLGAAAVLILHTQISGAVTAIAVGASAPALLAQLGATRAPPAPTESQTPSTPAPAESLTPSPPARAESQTPSLPAPVESPPTSPPASAEGGTS